MTNPPMQAQLVVNAALREVGNFESPPKSNNVKYNTWYYGEPVNGSAYPWCMVFCLWVYHQLNVRLPGNSASCTQMMRDGQKKGAFVTKNYQIGDLILLDFKGLKTPQHCGIIRKVNTYSIDTIEGNTGIGNNVNGGEVMKRERSYAQVIGAIRPIYEEGGLDMTIDEFIKNLTDKQAYEILTKASRHAGTLPEPSWSSKEKYWKEAMEKKIIDGKAPEAYTKRDEMIAILGRAGVI